MNPTVPTTIKSRRSVGWWVALACGLLLTPFLLLGVGVLSMLTLDRDAAFLRREVMASTDAKWHTKIQVSAGWMTLGAIRTGLKFIQAEHIDEARLALKAVRSASVGVYESTSRPSDLELGKLFNRTDRTMQDRGWTRLVGVAERNQTVLVYTSDAMGSDSRIDLCIAVLDGRQMVVVSTNVDAATLAQLAEKHLPKDGLRDKLNQAKL
jgi:hypothetical protein